MSNSVSSHTAPSEGALQKILSTRIYQPVQYFELFSLTQWQIKQVLFILTLLLSVCFFCSSTLDCCCTFYCKAIETIVCCFFLLL